MYELELGFMVVAAAQRDPGEYLAELSGYAAHPEGPLRRHAIDVALGRFPAALRHLVDAGPAHFDAALQLARDKVWNRAC
jgi:elongator complex protein 1